MGVKLPTVTSPKLNCLWSIEGAIQQTMTEKRSLLMTDLSEGDEECEHLLFQIEKMMMT
jgi:hypothetical protein